MPLKRLKSSVGKKSTNCAQYSWWKPRGWHYGCKNFTGPV